MNIKDIKENFPDFEILQEREVDIKGISQDSRNISQGDLFVAIRGERADGHDYINDAIRKGACGVVLEKDIKIAEDLVKIKVQNTRKSCSLLSELFFGFPSMKLKLVGITGTSGKTTTAYLIYSLFRNLGISAGFIGTIGSFVNDKLVSDREAFPPTTPEAFTLNRILKEMVDEKVKYAFIEVSSHSINLKRIYGINFYKKILTSMGIDHLDFHKTEEDYINTKASFFKDVFNPILNLDANYIDKFLLACDKPILYSVKQKADYYAEIIKENEEGILFNLKTSNNEQGEIFLKMFGEFNISNFLALSAFAINEGVDIATLKNFAGNPPIIPGRMQLINNKGFKILVDFAHNPFEIEETLGYLKKYAKGRIYTVFGVVGGSTYRKRVEMGKVVSSYSDFTYVSTDDPRGDDPGRIAEDVIKGIEPGKGKIMLNRREAIRSAILNAAKGDVVALLGRGDEVKMHFKDRVELLSDIEFSKEVLDEI